MCATTLVSCIMPTADRPRFMSQALAEFLQRDYANLELVVLDDGTESGSLADPGFPKQPFTHLKHHQTSSERTMELPLPITEGSTDSPSRCRVGDSAW